MHFAPIAPIGSEGLIMSTGYHFCFAEFAASDSDYARFFRSKVVAGETVVMDTLVYEAQIQLGNVPDLEQSRKMFMGMQGVIMRAISLVEPTYFVVPDVIGSVEGTLDNFMNFMSRISPMLPRGSFPMAVPQGHNYEEVAEAVYRMGKYTNFFGLSKVHESVSGADRYSLLLKLLQTGSINREAKVHFLGSDPTFRTAEQAAHDFRTKDMVMGVDCARPVYLGLHNLIMDSSGSKEVHRPEDYLNLSPALVKHHVDRIDANIRTVLRWLDSEV